MSTATAPRRPIETLEVLNRKAQELAFDVEDLDWARPMEREKLWSPPSIAPLTHLPSFALLSEEQQRRYNQLYAVAVCEQFVWFEQDLATAVLKNLLRQSDDMPPILREALETFIVEEEKHSEMFWRMAEKAAPELYPNGRRNALFKLSRPQQWIQSLLLSSPRFFLVWIWMIIFFEERTIDYARKYRKAEKANPGSIDANFLELHEFHMKDEGRHYQYDTHLLTWLYDPQSAWKKRLAGRMFCRIMKAYTAPRQTTRRIMERLGVEFPELKDRVLPALDQELPGLATNESFHEAAFSRKALPKSFELFAEYDELEPLWDHLVLEERSGPKKA